MTNPNIQAVSIRNGRTALYRFYDADLQPLYIGITSCHATRLDSHRRRSRQGSPRKARRAIARASGCLKRPRSCDPLLGDRGIDSEATGPTST